MHRKVYSRISIFYALLPLVLFLIIGSLLWKGLWLKPHELPSVLIGKPAPVFSAQSIERPETIMTEAIFKGQVTLLHVWASWCTSCQQEHVLLTELVKKHDLCMVGLNYFDDLKSATMLLKTQENLYQVNLFDPMGKIGMDYGVYGTPETFVIDQEGIVRYRHVGPIDKTLWQTELQPVIVRLQETKHG